jgi:hypothetical protein
MTRIFAIVILSVCGTFLIIFWLLQLVDVLKKDFPDKGKWIILLIFGNVIAATYYYSKIRPNVGKMKTPNVKKKSSSGGLISKPVDIQKVKEKKKRLETQQKKQEKEEEDEPPEPNVVEPVASESQPNQTIRSILQQQKAQTTPTDHEFVGYGEQRKWETIERNAAKPPVKGRPRVHEVDKLERNDSGLVITYGLHRKKIEWKDIFLLVAGQAPIGGPHTGLMVDIFTRKNYGSYRIFDKKILYQQFLPEVEYNIDKNFKNFLRYLVERVPDLPVDPDTKDFIEDEDKHYNQRYQSYHEFDEYAWRVRCQVVDEYGIKIQTDLEDVEETRTPQQKTYDLDEDEIIEQYIGKKPEEEEETSSPKRSATPVEPEVEKIAKQQPAEKKVETEKPPKKVKPSSKPKNDKFALILKSIDPQREQEVLKLICTLLKCSPQKGKRYLNTPRLIAKNVNRDVGLKISRKFNALGAQIQGISMEQYRKMKNKK